MQQKAFFRLMGLQYLIIYKQGKANVAADALSRRDNSEQFHSVTSVQTRRLEIISAAQAAIGGHSGVEATYKRVRALFSWPGMKNDIQKFIQSCEICRQAKGEHVRYPGLLQPRPIPPEAWHTSSMDLIEKLPLSQGFDTILVVVDKFSKYAHFVALHHPFTAVGQISRGAASGSSSACMGASWVRRARRVRGRSSVCVRVECTGVSVG